MKKMFWSGLGYFILSWSEADVCILFSSLEIRCKFLQVGHVGLTELD